MDETKDLRNEVFFLLLIFVNFATLWLFFYHKDSGLTESRHKAVFSFTAKNNKAQRCWLSYLLLILQYSFKLQESLWTLRLCGLFFHHKDSGLTESRHKAVLVLQQRIIKHKDVG